MSDDPFVVTAKGRACNNDVVRTRFFARGESRSFESRSAAEAFAARATREGPIRVVVQASAPQDDTCEAYLVAIPARNTTAPANPEADYWRFHTEANQQGELGEVLATTPPTNPPALTWFVRQDLDDPAGLVVRVDRAPDVVGRWQPDCRVDAVVAGEVVEQYVCEIKTGNASFQRGQRDGMDRAAESGRVLTARVRITDLPDEYEVHVREYEPGQSGELEPQ